MPVSLQKHQLKCPRPSLSALDASDRRTLSDLDQLSERQRWCMSANCRCISTDEERAGWRRAAFKDSSVPEKSLTEIHLQQQRCSSGQPVCLLFADRRVGLHAGLLLISRKNQHECLHYSLFIAFLCLNLIRITVRLRSGCVLQTVIKTAEFRQLLSGTKHYLI